MVLVGRFTSFIRVGKLICKQRDHLFPREKGINRVFFITRKQVRLSQSNSAIKDIIYFVSLLVEVVLVSLNLVLNSHFPVFKARIDAIREFVRVWEFSRTFRVSRGIARNLQNSRSAIWDARGVDRLVSCMEIARNWNRWVLNWLFSLRYVLGHKTL